MRKLILAIFLLIGIGVNAQFNIKVDTLFLDSNNDTVWSLYYVTATTTLYLNGTAIDLSGSLADMTKAIYDPQNISGDAFARANPALRPVAGLRSIS